MTIIIMLVPDLLYLMIYIKFQNKLGAAFIKLEKYIDQLRWFYERFC